MGAHNEFADVIIIAGGIVGTSIAYHLARMGAGKIARLAPHVSLDGVLGSARTLDIAPLRLSRFCTPTIVREVNVV